ncbi:MAG: hypothetical protein EG825_00455 [Rhodocyclaceae bacterium]|nr:hypothetical protein [Rhodocyclaceae bacterium]
MAGFREGRYSKGPQDNRYSTAIAPNTSGKTRAAGFGGMETGADGNLRQASYQSTFGKTSEDPTKASANPIRDIYADIPKPEGSSFAGSVLKGVAGKVGENFANKGLDYMKSAMKGVSGGASADPGFIGDTGSLTDVTANHWVDFGGDFMSTGADNFTGFVGDTGSMADIAANDWVDFGGDFMSTGGEMAADAAGSLADSAGSALGEVSFLGPALQLAQGNVGGAAGSVIGGLIAGPIGAAIGGFFGGGGCFLTEATMYGMGIQDPAQLEQSEPLQVLRWFRDNVMARTPQGKNMIQQYYLMAPDVVEAVNRRPDAKQIYSQIYGQFIAPAVEAIKANQFPKALEIYAAMIQFVAPFGAEMDGDPNGESEFEELADQSAMVNANPDIGQAVANPMSNIIAR